MIHAEIMTSSYRDRSRSPYAEAKYVQSLGDVGVPVELRNSGGWLLKRSIPNAGDSRFDACGPYPLFDCRNWRELATDLQTLADKLVSVVVVVDPWADVDVEQLRQIFPDQFAVYKQHFIVDLRPDAPLRIPEHHRRNIRKSQAEVQLERVQQPAAYHQQWCELYARLIERHSITGIQRFSDAAFRLQMDLPNCEAFIARKGGHVCGMTLWLTSARVAYYHLAAYSDAGYVARASYALFAMALDHFREFGMSAASLGAGAGLQDADDGLTRFKRGWATHCRPVYLCGRTLQPEISAALRTCANRTQAGEFFPPYRVPGCPQPASDWLEPVDGES